jgi:hypothetical protein
VGVAKTNTKTQPTPAPEDTGPCTIPLEDEDGNVVVICQENVGTDNEVGGGEYPDPTSPPKDPGQAAAEQRALDNRSEPSGDR